MDISSIRKDYSLRSLEISDVNANPLIQFQKWFDEALNSEVLEVNAMCLSTLGLDGFPNGRIVLLKGVDSGFVFFTNYESQKGLELESDPNASMTFFWAELERQIRVKGRIEKISPEESDVYFYSRPLGSQIGAWVSPQSKIIASREVLEENQHKIEQELEDTPIKRPQHWGGYRLIANQIEFWQGRPSRLHDRIRFDLESGNWKISRLAP